MSSGWVWVEIVMAWWPCWKLLKIVRGLGRVTSPPILAREELLWREKEKCLARLQGRESRVERVPICHISKNFRSVGWMYAS